jgi:hypothetical protein
MGMFTVTDDAALFLQNILAEEPRCKVRVLLTAG